MSTKEVVMIVGGNLGSKISDAIWKLFYQEYGIDADRRCKNIEVPDLPVETFFELTDKKIIPRTVILASDSELDFMKKYEIANTWNPQFYHPDSIIGLKEINDDSFFMDSYRFHQDAVEKPLERIRVMCEKCSNLQGFIICRCHYCPTAGGVISKLLEELTDYEKKTKIDFAVNTPYDFMYETRGPILNTFFTISHCMENVDCCFISDVRAVNDMCERNLKSDYCNKYLDKIEAQAFSTVTSPVRYADWSLDNYKMLVPHKDIPFVTMAYAPLASPKQMMYHDQSIGSITNECLQRRNQMLSYDPRKGAYISSLFIYRGSELNDKDIWNTFSKINAQCEEGRYIRCANGIKKPFQAKSVRTETTTLIDSDIGCPRQSVISCSNNTALYYYWQELALYMKETLKAKTPGRFNTIYEKLIHRYGEHQCNEDLNRVNERLLDMLDKYAEFDSEIKHDRSTAGFLPLK